MPSHERDPSASSEHPSESRPMSRPPGQRSGDRELPAGTHVGRYVLLHRLGRGGMGVVYAAYDPKLDRKVAIKIMRRRGGNDPERSQGRMLREAQALAKLSHPNVVAVHDTGIIEGQIFVAMDYVQGSDVRRWLREKPRSRAAIVDMMAQAGDGLAAAHAAGIVHRDFKPDNVIVGVDGRAQVLDFGLARVRSETDDGGAGTATPASTDRADAHAGRRPAGTPAYMAPEQHLGHDVDATADQFAFCVTLYEALCGRPPHSPDGKGIKAAIIASEIREPPRHSPMPRALRRIVWRGLAADPADRYPSMKALLLDLRKRRGVRRRVVALTAGALVLGGASVAVLGPDAAPQPCTGADAKLAEVWGDPHRAQLRAAFEATQRPDAELSASGVQLRFDDYGVAWRAMYEDACLATHVRKEQSAATLDLRMECLDTRRRQLGALVAALIRAEATALDQAPVAAAKLPPLSVCSDAQALRDRLPMPGDPAVRTEIAELRERMAHAAALQAIGELVEALKLMEPVAARADAVGWAPLTAEAQHQLGTILHNAGRWGDAEVALTNAAVAAEEGRNDRLLAVIRTALVVVVGDRGARPREGHLWARLARSAIARYGGDLSLSARLETNLAFVLDREAKPEDVLAHHERALALLDQAGTQGLLRASVHGNLATTLAEVGRGDEALHHAKTALSIWTEAVGEHHVNTATAVAALAYVLDDIGRSDEAIAQYEHALSLTEAALGPDSPVAARRLENLAIAHARNGELTRATEEFTRVLKIFEDAHGEHHADVASAASNLGAALGMAGRRAEALVQHRRALEVREALFGSEHLELAGPLDGIANQLENLERAGEALPYRERALAIRQRVYGPDHAELTHPLSNLASNLLAVGKRARAEAIAERAVAVSAGAAVKPSERAFAAAVLAHVLAESGRDPDRTRALIDAATRDLGDDAAPIIRGILARANAALD